MSCPSGTRLLVASVLFVVAVAPAALAHGGSYRGPSFPPTPATPPPPSPPPGTLGGKTPPSGVPRGTTPGADPQRWETWWAFNKEEFFPYRGALKAVPTGPEGYANTDARPPGREEARAQIIPVLLDLLKNEKEVNIRDSAAVALGKVGDVREFEALEKLLADSERVVAEAAALGLGLLKDERAEKRLIELAKDASRKNRIRGMAVVALGLSGGERAREFLYQDLGSAAGGPLSDTGAANELESLRVYAAGIAAGSDLRPRDADPDADPGTGFILSAIAKNQVRDNLFVPIAHAALAKTRDPAAQRAVLAGIGHAKADVRGGAAIAAGRVFRKPDAQTVKDFAKAIADEGDLFPKRMLIISLGRMGGEPAIKALEAVFREKDRQNRSFAALALGLAGAKESAPMLRAELKGAKDSSLTAALAISLGLLGDPESGPLVLDLIKDRKDPELRAHLVEALILLKPQGTIPVLEKLLADSRTPELQAAISLAMGLIDPAATTKALMEVLRGSGTVTVKAAIASGLARSGDARVLEPMLAFVKDPKQQPLARAFGVVALGILGEKDPRLPPFARYAIDSDYDLHHQVLDEVRDLL